jgi:trypsin
MFNYLAIPDATEDLDFLSRSGRIVGGNTAGSGQFRYMVSLRTSINVHFCGGTLFSNRWIVSAAQCTTGRSMGHINAVIGAISNTVGGNSFSIARIVNHPSYSTSTLANDISLLQTVANTGTSSTIAPATLGSAFIGGGVTVVATGWGQTSHPGTPSLNLRFVVLTTLTNADCRSRFGAANAALIFDNTMCTFTRAGQGICMGDSGGPLATGNTLVGVISWAVPCGVGFPDVYARISSHRSWIAAVSGV